MNPTNYRFTYAQIIALFCGIVLMLLFSMHYRLGTELADDGAFFLRYAENMLKGEFWVWNPGELPVWGASAPLYPLLIALPMKLGLSPEASIIGIGLAFSSISLAAVTLMLGHRFGIITGIAFVAFASLDTGMMYFSGAGLETPLTIALLAFALWTLLYKPSTWVIGIAAGLLMINKLDLVPVGGLLLIAHWVQDKQFPKVAFIVAAAVAVAWYGFAWWHFGAPVPNYFLTKSLYQNDHPKSINWTWFGGFVFWVGIHKWLTGLSMFALWRNARSLFPIVIFLGGMLLIHLIAYTIKFPFEPYNWYAMPALLVLLVGGAIGARALADYANQRLSKRLQHAGVFVFTILIIFVVLLTAFRSEIMDTSNIKMFASHQEFDRAQAGRWVAENTPKDFVVFTMWGNPAYYSKRMVLDGSFLNRRYEAADLIKKYHPEILIMQNNPGSTPMVPIFAATKAEDYRVIKVFDKTYSAGMDYFFAVLAREDVIDKIRNIDPPRDLMAFVHDVKLGDQFGILKPLGLGTLFVHPGANTATQFNFTAADYLRDSKDMILRIHARIDPNIPEDAIVRGAGNVHLIITQDKVKLADAIVKVGEPLQRGLTVSGSKPLQFTVDNNGGADTDWLLLSIQ